MQPVIILNGTGVSEDRLIILDAYIDPLGISLSIQTANLISLTPEYYMLEGII